MKYKAFLIFFFIIISSCFSQELNEQATYLKDNQTETYNEILKFSENKWGSDYKMIVITVNEQATAMFEIVKLMEASDYDQNIFKNASHITTL